MFKISHFIFFFGFLTFLAALSACNNQGNDFSIESSFLNTRVILSEAQRI